MSNRSTVLNEAGPHISRRGFMVAAGVTAATAWLAPRRLLAADDGIVGAIKQAAATE